MHLISFLLLVSAANSINNIEGQWGLICHARRDFAYKRVLHEKDDGVNSDDLIGESNGHTQTGKAEGSIWGFDLIDDTWWYFPWFLNEYRLVLQHTCNKYSQWETIDDQDFVICTMHTFYPRCSIDRRVYTLFGNGSYERSHPKPYSQSWGK